MLIDDIPITKKPDNESQVALLFGAILANDKTRKLVKFISKIGHYSQQSSTDMICIDYKEEMVLAEVEYKLSNLFIHEHPYETFDYVICWSVDLEINEKKRLSDGNVLCLVRDNEDWMLKYGTQKIIPIIELKSIISKIENHTNIEESS